MFYKNIDHMITDHIAILTKISFRSRTELYFSP